MSTQEKNHFNVVMFVIMSILMACAIYPALVLKWITPFMGGMGLLLFVALPHGIGLFLSLKENNTRAGCVIGLFFSFWMLLGIELQLPFWTGMNQSLTLKHYTDFKFLLVFVEGGMALIIFALQMLYRNTPILRRLLCGLGGTVAILFILKLSQIPKFNKIYGMLDAPVSSPPSSQDALAAITVVILGIWSYLVFLKLIRKDTKEVYS